MLWCLLQINENQIILMSIQTIVELHYLNILGKESLNNMYIYIEVQISKIYRKSLVYTSLIVLNYHTNLSII